MTTATEGASLPSKGPSWEDCNEHEMIRKSVALAECARSFNGEKPNVLPMCASGSDEFAGMTAIMNQNIELDNIKADLENKLRVCHELIAQTSVQLNDTPCATQKPTLGVGASRHLHHHVPVPKREAKVDSVSRVNQTSDSNLDINIAPLDAYGGGTNGSHKSRVLRRKLTVVQMECESLQLTVKRLHDEIALLNTTNNILMDGQLGGSTKGCMPRDGRWWFMRMTPPFVFSLLLIILVHCFVVFDRWCGASYKRSCLVQELMEAQASNFTLNSGYFEMHDLNGVI